jgi:hypothetical protein
MSIVALSMSKVRWLEKGARNCVVLAAKARPLIPMHQRWLEKGARNCVVLAAKARPWIPMHHSWCFRHLIVIEGTAFNVPPSFCRRYQTYLCQCQPDT